MEQLALIEEFNEKLKALSSYKIATANKTGDDLLHEISLVIQKLNRFVTYSEQVELKLDAMVEDED